MIPSSGCQRWPHDSPARPAGNHDDDAALTPLNGTRSNASTRTAPIGAIQSLYRLIRIIAASEPLKVAHQILSKPVAKVGNDQSNNDQCGNCNDLHPTFRLLITQYDIVFHIFLHGYQESVRHEGTRPKLSYIKLSQPRVAPSRFAGQFVFT